MTKQFYYMKQAIRCAEKARGNCSPNPFVGAVIVKDETIIARGWTQSYGSDHAEIHALKQAGAQANGADMYVTLEPCSHYGKTPPCALAVIAAGIKRVFIGITDPNPLVSGKGIKLLTEASIEVQSGLFAEEITRQLEYFLCYIQQQRPFVTLKTALTLDGKYAAQDGSSRWISGEKARLYTHKLRSQYDVILTGIKTIMRDDPLLTARLPGKPKQPLRVVLDPALKLPVDSQFARSMQEFSSLVFCSCGIENSAKFLKLKDMGAILVGLPIDKGHFCINDVLAHLASLNKYSVLLETGSGLAEAFLQARLVDKCLFFYGAKILGGSHSPLPNLGIANIQQAISLTNLELKQLGDTILLSAYPVW
ncbi:MAG: bifunctional diaminohydroxyphosphoribosylaminopyrimidine deaminase/5-amino-6-(5-phosphoribosylamino)uracil reductase RibD [Candidatus Cloacimonas sp.]|nr:bifunctional diaminohydroxyphosphoribosylaminopyrimidine deaminase/5-amino-6-(5-phosphoribosylamino)uracil reductase RibD [Candidatus Cloacimonas sp.]